MNSLRQLVILSFNLFQWGSAVFRFHYTNNITFKNMHIILRLIQLECNELTSYITHKNINYIAFYLTTIFFWHPRVFCVRAYPGPLPNVDLTLSCEMCQRLSISSIWIGLIYRPANIAGGALCPTLPLKDTECKSSPASSEVSCILQTYVKKMMVALRSLVCKASVPVK